MNELNPDLVDVVFSRYDLRGVVNLYSIRIDDEFTTMLIEEIDREISSNLIPVNPKNDMKVNWKKEGF